MKPHRPYGKRAAAAGLAAALSLACLPAYAQDDAKEGTTPGAGAPSLMLQLNGLDKSAAGCRFTFVIHNTLGHDLDKTAFEMVLFGKSGSVDRLTVLDFKALPEGKTKVRQFDIPQTDCASLSRVLINDATQCEGEGVDAKACIEQLKTESKVDAEFGK